MGKSRGNFCTSKGCAERQSFAFRREHGRCSCGFHIGLWLSLVERFVRDEEAAGSNPASPRISNSTADLPRVFPNTAYETLEIRTQFGCEARQRGSYKSKAPLAEPSPQAWIIPPAREFPESTANLPRVFPNTAYETLEIRTQFGCEARQRGSYKSKAPLAEPSPQAWIIPPAREFLVVAQTSRESCRDCCVESREIRNAVRLPCAAMLPARIPRRSSKTPPLTGPDRSFPTS